MGPRFKNWLICSSEHIYKGLASQSQDMEHFNKMVLHLILQIVQQWLTSRFSEKFNAKQIYGSNIITKNVKPKNAVKKLKTSNDVDL